MSTWSITVDDEAWYPEQRGTGYGFTKDLKPDRLVIWRRRPCRLIEIRERPHADWPEAYREAWVKDGAPEPGKWWHRPMTVVIKVEGEPDAKPLPLLANASYGWTTLPEHYAVCRLCGELPPCTHVHNEKVMASAAKRMDHDMAIMPGCCHHCGEPITSRQKMIRFEGENLIRPDLGDDTALFHARKACLAAAQRYDARWAQAEAGRRRKLYCDGLARHHHDGTMDCTEGALCPGDVLHSNAEWHSPGSGRITSGCWCVSGDLTARIEQQMRDGEVAP